MGATVEELRTILGLESINQVRNRIAALEDLLEGHIRRGSNYQLIIDDSGIVLLRRLEDLHKGGLTLKEAADRIRQEIEDNSQKMLGANLDEPGETRTIHELREIIARQDREIERLVSELERLHRQLEIKDQQIDRLHDLLNRQLPGRRERGKPWWQFWK